MGGRKDEGGKKKKLRSINGNKDNYQLRWSFSFLGAARL